jgi:uncharacterized protein YcnI
MGHKQLLLAAALGALAIPASAQAHVSLHPNILPAGSGPTIDIRVPNETSNARTVKVDVQLPAGITFLATEPVAGWTAKVTKKKLATPIKTDDGDVTEEASQITWTATPGKGTPAGDFQNFPVQMAVPGKDGDVLSFKTVQTYSNASVVRWIGPPTDDHPAPTVDVTAEGGLIQDRSGDAGPPAPGAGTGADAAPTTTPATPAAAVPVAASSDGASKGLGIAALVIAILALLAGGAALVRARS